jgi:hypothetical protein
MRTKTLFLTAAALAAGLATSMAQNVYSVNIVGYISVPLAAGQAALLSNPLDNGTNDITSIDNGAIPNKSTASSWNGAAFVSSKKSSGAWSPNLSIPPGAGFFVTPNAAATVTFVGSAPTSNNVVLGTTAALVGAVPPIAGNLNDSGPNTLNIGPALPNKTTVSTWGGASYSTAKKASGSFTPNLSVGVAQGFFVTPNAGSTWSVYLQ